MLAVGGVCWVAVIAYLSLQGRPPRAAAVPADTHTCPLENSGNRQGSGAADSESMPDWRQVIS